MWWLSACNASACWLTLGKLHYYWNWKHYLVSVFRKRHSRIYFQKTYGLLQIQGKQLTRKIGITMINRAVNLPIWISSSAVREKVLKTRGCNLGQKCKLTHFIYTRLLLKSLSRSQSLLLWLSWSLCVNREFVHRPLSPSARKSVGYCTMLLPASLSSPQLVTVKCNDVCDLQGSSSEDYV